MDDYLIHIENVGGTTCICRHIPANKAVSFYAPSGEGLLHFHKECPIHGIGRIFHSDREKR